ncbi:MAG: hypothetical protein WD468_00525 [Pirellulales bacterium]
MMINRSLCIVLGFVLFFLIGGPAASAQEVKPQPFDPSGLVRFDNLENAESRRQKLVTFVWSGGLPTTTLPEADKNVGDTVFAPAGDLETIDPANAEAVDRLKIEVTGGFDYHSIGYWIRPKTKNANNKRLVVVHSGHRTGKILDGVNIATDALLKDGFNVVLMDMPLVGWNTDNSFRMPDGSMVSINMDQGMTDRHNELFDKVIPKLREDDGAIFRFFIEPTVQSINYFLANSRDANDVNMIGLSGGGWSTHVASAIDSRIKISVPVAGALPLYARGNDDAEQDYYPLFGEAGSPPVAKGVASWLEVFALGGIGDGRRQIQLLNLHDSCCFYGDKFKTYDEWLSQRVDHIGHGNWDFYSDTSHKSHLISPKALNDVILPALLEPAGQRP